MINIIFYSLILQIIVRSCSTKAHQKAATSAIQAKPSSRPPRSPSLRRFSDFAILAQAYITEPINEVDQEEEEVHQYIELIHEFAESDTKSVKYFDNKARMVLLSSFTLSL